MNLSDTGVPFDPDPPKGLRRCSNLNVSGTQSSGMLEAFLACEEVGKTICVCSVASN